MVVSTLENAGEVVSTLGNNGVPRKALLWWLCTLLKMLESEAEEMDQQLRALAALQ